MWACVRHFELPWGPQVCHLRAPRLVPLPTARIPPHELARSLQLLFENNPVTKPRVPDVEFEDQIALCADPRTEREVVLCELKHPERRSDTPINPTTSIKSIHSPSITTSRNRKMPSC